MSFQTKQQIVGQMGYEVIRAISGEEMSIHTWCPGLASGADFLKN